MNSLPGLNSLTNIHPLFIHFPVALILITLLAEAAWMLTKKEHIRVFSTYLLYLAALSAVVTVATGYWAANALGHETPGHEFVHAHRDVMVWMSGFLAVTAISVLAISSLRAGKLRKFVIIPLVFISGLLLYGADKGGQLVFEFGIGVKTSSKSSVENQNGHHHEKENEVSDHEKHESDLSADKDHQATSHTHDHEE